MLKKRRKLWLVLFTLLVLVTTGVVLATREFWKARIAQSLACKEELRRSDLILVENIALDYVLFERAATLQRAGLGARVFIPVQVSHESERANSVLVRIAQLMAGTAEIQRPEIEPIRAAEPISLNSAYKVRDYMTENHLGSVTVVTSGFRSKRSSLIYEKVLGPSGIAVVCVPVFTGASPSNWSKTWHGVEEVAEQFLKLQFYRFYVFGSLGLSEFPDAASPKITMAASD